MKITRPGVSPCLAFGLTVSRMDGAVGARCALLGELPAKAWNTGRMPVPPEARRRANLSREGHSLMKIHENQAKQILAQYGVPTPMGQVATSVEEAEAVARDLSLPVAVKAQVHVGGRGKAGGIKLARKRDEVGKVAGAILGMNIKGSVVRKVLVESGVDIAQEIYCGLIIDRASKHIVLMVSAAGGVEIEEVAAATPEKILKIELKRHLGLPGHVARRAAYFLGLPSSAARPFATIASGLYRAFVEKDC